MSQRQQWKPQRRQNEQGEAVIDFGNGVLVPAEIERDISDKDLPYIVTLVLTFQKERYEVAEVRFAQRRNREPVSGFKLRQVPLDRLARQLMTEWMPLPKKSQIIRRAEVAALYRLAYALHLPPTKTVAECLGISQKAAEQRVVSARNDGLLPATEQGKAKV